MENLDHGRVPIDFGRIPATRVGLFAIACGASLLSRSQIDVDASAGRGKERKQSSRSHTCGDIRSRPGSQQCKFRSQIP